MPALVALEEAYEFTCYPMKEDEPGSAPDVGCNDPEIAGAFTDQLDDTLAALGGKYYRAAEITNFDLPRSIPALDRSIRAFRSCIRATRFSSASSIGTWYLARSDVTHDTADPQGILPSERRRRPEGCNYAMVAAKDTGASSALGPDRAQGPARLRRRGWRRCEGQPYKFIATHLETRLESERHVRAHLPVRPGRRTAAVPAGPGGASTSRKNDSCGRFQFRSA